MRMSRKLMLVVVVGVVLSGCAGGPRGHREAMSLDPRQDGWPASTPEIRIGAAPDPPVPGPGWASIGRSVEGREILATGIGGAAGRGGRRVLVIGSIHGNEREGLRAVDQLVADLRARPPGATVRIVRDMNPDGSATRTRGNARGVDLNRNWPASSFTPAADRGGAALSEPESRAVFEEIERFGPTLVVVLHSTAAGPFVNYDGPAAEAAALFAAAAGTHDPRWRVVSDMGYPTPGSLGSLIGIDRGIAILTIEFKRGEGAERVGPSLVAGVRVVAREGTR